METRKELPEPSVIVTKHAAKRIKERVGLPKRAIERQAEAALRDGVTHAATRGRLHRYLDKLYLQHRSANNLRVHGEFIYLFAGEVLVTVLPLPRDMRSMT